MKNYDVLQKFVNLSEVNYCVLDTETTGLDENAVAIEEY